MKPSTLDNLPAEVWKVMQFREGHLQRITKAEIAQAIYGEYTETIDRQIRDAVAYLVTREYRPIVATSDGAGYFVARNLEEAQHAIAEIDSRIGALVERKRGLLIGLTGKNVGQASLL